MTADMRAECGTIGTFRLQQWIIGTCGTHDFESWRPHGVVIFYRNSTDEEVDWADHKVTGNSVRGHPREIFEVVCSRRFRGVQPNPPYDFKT